MNAATRSALSSIFAAVHSPSGLPFPEVVTQLTSLGISRYRVDYIMHNVTAYTSSTSTTIPSQSPASNTIPFPHVPSYTFASWNKEGIVGAIRRAQAGEGNYLEFSEAVVGCGVVEYTVYVSGRKVVYEGEEGEVHVEWFPGAGPGAGNE